ncbi:MAG: hypothetical protein JXA10_13680 [Anaerolineae bacterium]|nr:hypothetical protein [Anaerolineae bacterium]
MRSLCVLVLVLSVLLTACGDSKSDDESAALPPAITTETVEQIALRQILDAEDMLYFDPVLSPDGRAALFTLMSYTDFIPIITVFDTFTGEQLLVIPTEKLSAASPTSYATNTAYSPDGTQIMIGISPLDDAAGEIAIFDATNGDEMQRFTVPHLSSGGAAYALDGEVIVASTFDDETVAAGLVVLDATNGDLLGELALAAPIVWLEAQNNVIAYNTYQGDTVLPFAREGSTITFGEAIYTHDTRSMGYYPFAPDGSLFTILDGTARHVRLYAMADGALQSTISIPGEADSSILDAYTDGEFIVTSEGNMVRIFDRGGTLLTERENPSSLALCRMDAGRITLLCSSEGSVAFWGVSDVD